MPRNLGWWERCVEAFQTHWRDEYAIGGTYGGMPITEIALRGSHHHRPDHYDVYSGDELLVSLSDRCVATAQYVNWPVPPHQVYIPTPSTRSTAPPEGEVWCPHTRQQCWGPRCAMAGRGCAGHLALLEVVA